MWVRLRMNSAVVLAPPLLSLSLRPSLYLSLSRPSSLLGVGCIRHAANLNTKSNYLYNTILGVLFE